MEHSYRVGSTRVLCATTGASRPDTELFALLDQTAERGESVPMDQSTKSRLGATTAITPSASQSDVIYALITPAPGRDSLRQSVIRCTV